jgi:murein DD-endopeptidase MepM/ murein hydrolase activator NlpD
LTDAQSLTRSHPGGEQLRRQITEAIQAEEWDHALRMAEVWIQIEPEPTQDLLDFRDSLARKVMLSHLFPLPTPLPKIPFLVAPFQGSFPLTNGFDHDPSLGQITTLSGQVLSPGSLCAQTDNHVGYDWSMPIGTVVQAVASGRVTVARSEWLSDCPLLQKPTQGLWIRIRHDWGEQQWESVYVHLSQIDVVEGQSVNLGDPIGLSGNSGCSTGPHLHFEIRQFAPRTPRFPAKEVVSIPMDPYGWFGEAPDPWLISNIWLWRPGQFPSLDPCLQVKRSALE